MKTAVLGSVREPPYAATRPLEVLDLERPEPRAHEILVRISLASLCHSDLSVVNGSRPRPLPMALGHEAVGVVETVGAGVTDIVPGNTVVLVFVPSCYACPMCMSGRPALCAPAAKVNGDGVLLHGPSLIHDRHGQLISHHLGVSAFSEFAVVAEESAIVIPDDVPHEVAALLGCGVLTGIGAVVNTGRMEPGQSVAVFGMGAVGLSSIMAAAAIGARNIIAIDPSPEKLDVARAAGASAAVAPVEATEYVASLGLDGVDLSIEAVGSARVLEAAFGLLSRGGTTVSVGLPHPEQTITLQALAFAGSGRKLLGSYMGDSVPRRDIPHYLELWKAGRLPLELLHTDTKPMSEINEGLDALAAGHVVRRLFIPGT